jgi:hypothetical protein
MLISKIREHWHDVHFIHIGTKVIIVIIVIVMMKKKRM